MIRQAWRVKAGNGTESSPMARVRVNAEGQAMNNAAVAQKCARARHGPS